jgi:hypothetical protein
MSNDEYDPISIVFECPHCGASYPAEELHLCLDDQDADLQPIEDWNEE